MHHLEQCLAHSIALQTINCHYYLNFKPLLAGVLVLYTVELQISLQDCSISAPFLTNVFITPFSLCPQKALLC